MSKSVARQPIFDKNLSIYAYELLFRGDAEDVAGQFDPDKATSSVLVDALLSIGMDKVTQGKLAFVNFSRGMLVSDMLSAVPTNQIALEILESVDPDPFVLAACEKLKNDGYTLILDDFVYKPSLDPLIKLASIIKIDVLNSTPKALRDIPLRFRDRKILFLAEKVETYDQFRQVLDWGYSLFQGYFFCRPQTMDSGDISGNKLVYFQLIKELHDPATDPDKIEHIIQKDVSLSYTLIRYINSAAFGLKSKIHSIKHAVTLLGNKRLRDFSTLLLFKSIGDDKPGELITAAIIRGRFAEQIAIRIGLEHQASEAFLIGMFSLMDALLDRPMKRILSELNLDEDITAALQRQPGKLTSILETVIAYEQASWDKYEIYRQMIGLRDDDAHKMYVKAVEWADEIAKQGRSG